MTFVRFGLFVTGKGEAQFLPRLFRVFHSLAPNGCHFEVLARINQRRPRSQGRRLQMAGSGKTIADSDTSDFGIPARNWLHGNESAHVLLIDDLEWDWRDQHTEVFARYRKVFDTVLPESMQRRVAVFFLVMMLEAYYFGDPSALRAVLGIDLGKPEIDLEAIRHPKNELKRLHRGFDEIEHGLAIVERLDLARVLSNPSTCLALRTMFAWVGRALELPADEHPWIFAGQRCPVTGPQLD